MVCLFECARLHTMPKIFSFICIIVFSAVYLLTIYSNFRLEIWGRSKLFFGVDVDNIPSPNPSAKLILYWNTLFGDETFYFGRGNIFQNCPEVDSSNCYATNDRSIANIEHFDAILFHGSELKRNDLPDKRSPQQFYIFTNLESPASRPLTDSFFENYFNLTMTYRLDSDIPWPYAIVRDRANGNDVWPLHSERQRRMWHDRTTAAENSVSSHDRMNNVKWSRGKTKSVVWFVSNCESKSGRQNYVDDMKKYIDVDVYGNCGSESCTRDENCFETVVEPHYYFYLSFENSLCQDYVTEKLFNAMSYRVVPVVYGGANYSRFAPPNSYINALDFESPQHLAKYLKTLIERPNEYAKYFKWKEQYEVGNPNELTICQLCRILNSKPIVKKVYNPLSTWYLTDKCPLQKLLDYSPYITSLDIKT